MAHRSWRGEDREPPNDCGANRWGLDHNAGGYGIEFIVKSYRSTGYLQSSNGHLFQQAPRVC